MKTDAVFLISFGGPEKRQDIMPFLEIVTRGRGIPKARLEDVAHHYEAIGGKSPINEITRRQAQALEEALQKAGTPLKVYIGQRNWHPFIEDTLRKMASDGMKHVVGVMTAAHACQASTERYIQAVEDARKKIGAQAPTITYVRSWFDHPLFIDAICERVTEALHASPGLRPPSPYGRGAGGEAIAWLFTAHSIPLPMAQASAYVQELETTARLVSQKLGRSTWRLAYSSRSGRPEDPWLEPDVCNAIREEAAHGANEILLVPIGFVADHVEVLYDLDVEAAQAAKGTGVTLYRAKTVGDHPLFIRMMADITCQMISSSPAATGGGTIKI
jgi:ferrochelatase